MGGEVSPHEVVGSVVVVALDQGLVDQTGGQAVVGVLEETGSVIRLVSVRSKL